MMSQGKTLWKDPLERPLGFFTAPVEALQLERPLKFLFTTCLSRQNAHTEAFQVFPGSLSLGHH